MVEHVVPPPHRATGVSTRHALRRRLDLLQSRRSLNGRASLFWASLVGFSGDQPRFGEEASSSDLSLGLFNLVTPRLCMSSDFPIRSLVSVLSYLSLTRGAHFLYTYSLHGFLSMPLVLRKPPGTAGSAVPAIAIGLFVAFGGVLFGCVLFLS